MLGVSKGASDKDLRKAYRSLSKKYHPDKNPDNEEAQAKFVEVSDAYDILSNEESRKIYDTRGHAGIEQWRKNQNGPGRGGGNPFDIFSRFFGGGGGPFGGSNKGPNLEVRLAVPLREFYTGVTRDFTMDKEVICDQCHGSGSDDGKMDTCGQCGGAGQVVQKLNLAPGIFQQVAQPCGACRGRGQVIKRPCRTCGGHKVVRQVEQQTLHVERGMPRGNRIIYENEANESPDQEPGDMILTLMEQEPLVVQSDGAKDDGTFFRRRNEDLYWREVLSLREAWMGDWTRNITHLDGHVVKLSRKRGEVVQPGTVEPVKGEGMPIWKSDEQGEHELKFGYLLVEYVVVLPDQMESAMEKDFWATWDKWRKKKGVSLDADSGRPSAEERQKQHEEL